MPHLHFEYSARLDALVEMDAFAQRMRLAIAQTGLFPLGGIRVRGFAATCEAVADGAPGRLFLDMELRIGRGRSEADRLGVTDSLYDAAQSWLEPRLAGRPFALSLELREIDPAYSRKSWNTLHDALGPEE